jgi:hypothetical protein
MGIAELEPRQLTSGVHALEMPLLAGERLLSSLVLSAALFSPSYSAPR